MRGVKVVLEKSLDRGGLDLEGRCSGRRPRTRRRRRCCAARLSWRGEPRSHGSSRLLWRYESETSFKILLRYHVEIHVQEMTFPSVEYLFDSIFLFRFRFSFVLQIHWLDSGQNSIIGALEIPWPELY